MRERVQDRLGPPIDRGKPLRDPAARFEPRAASGCASWGRRWIVLWIEPVVWTRSPG